MGEEFFLLKSPFFLIFGNVLLIVTYACLRFGGIARAIHVNKNIEAAPLLKLEANNREESPGKLNSSE